MQHTQRADHVEASGMRALVRAGESRDWFFGHLGAAFLAGAQLLRNGALPEPARDALAVTLARLEDEHSNWYAPLETGGRSPASSEPLLRALTDDVHRLRNSGHGTIYVVSALRAFRHQPTLASQRCVDALLALHATAQRDDPTRYLGCDDYFAIVRRAESVPATPASLHDALVAALRSCRRVTPDIVRDGRRYFLFGEKIHVLTHLHALHRLGQLGHGALAVAGLAAHRVQLELGEIPDDVHRPVPPPSALQPTSPAFWESDGVDIWHKLKLAEAVTTLLPFLPPDERAAARRAVAGMWALLGVDAP